MDIKCKFCNSLNIHKYSDCLFCFDCRKEIERYREVNSAGIKNTRNSSFLGKLSGNKSEQKRYYPGLK